MSDLDKLKAILDHQAERGIRSGKHERLSYYEVNFSEGTDLKIPSLKVGFQFSLNGRLLGAYNWKE